MSLPLLDKEFYSLKELSELWGHPLHRIRYYPENGILRVKVKIKEKVVRVLRPKTEADGKTVYEPKGFISYDDYAFLSPQNVRDIFNDNGAPILVFGARNSIDMIELYHSTTRYRFNEENIFVSHKERLRFEQLCNVKSANDIADQSNASLHPVSVGRPSTTDKVVAYFRERCRLGIVLPKIGDEVFHLEEWGKANIKGKTPPSFSAISNKIRAEYWAYWGKKTASDKYVVAPAGRSEAAITA